MIPGAGAEVLEQSHSLVETKVLSMESERVFSFAL
jgi:hypothetical protein